MKNKIKNFLKFELFRKSTLVPGIVITKKASAINSISEAQKIEKKLNLLAERELIENENKGCV